jgi:hypothetical protein
MPMAWMAMAGIGAMALGGWWADRINKDRKAFNKMVRDEGITDPREVWELCSGYHKKLRAELVEAKARIEAGEEICRVGQGLAELRKMMKGPELDGMLKLKQLFGGELTEEEKSEALAKIQKDTVPLEVKRAIIAHWWTELWQLFVPWGILMPDEIERVEGPFFRLVGPDVREAVLRGEVLKYKELYQSYKKMSDEQTDSKIKINERHRKEREDWRTEKTELLEKIVMLNSIVARHESGELDDDV